MALIERPHQLCWSKNEIRYVFQLDELARPGLFLQVQIVYHEVNNSTGQLLPVFDLKPDANGFVYCYIQKYLDSLLSYVTPAVGVFTNADKQARYFYLFWREVTDEIPDPEWNEEEADHLCYVIKGGIEKHTSARNNFWINYFDVQKPWLTWQPSGRYIFAGEKVFLTFLNKLIDATGYQVKVEVTLTDGSLANYDINFTVTNGLLFHVAVDMDSLNIAGNAVGDVASWKVAVHKGTTFYTQFFRFNKEYRPAYYFYDLFYHGSLGGFDHVRMKGDVDESFDRSFDEAEGGFNLNDWTDKTKIHETSHTGLVLRRNYKGDAGFLRSEREQKALIELLASTSIYHLVNDRWVPVLSVSKSGDVGQRRDKIRSFAIEWSLSEVNEVYTPWEIGFGEGSIPPPEPPEEPECVAPSMNAALPDATVGQDYYAVRAISGTAPFTMSDLVKPSWMTVTLAGSTITFGGRPITAATNVHVSFTITNCSPDPFDFDDTIDVQQLEYNVGVTNNVSGVSVQDVIFNSAPGTPYEFFPLATGESGSASLPLEVSSTITVRFNGVPPTAFALQIRINGVLLETTTVSSPMSIVVVSANSYTIHDGDTVQITVT